MDKPLKSRQSTIGAGSNAMGSTMSTVSLASSSDRDQQLEKLLKENKQLKQKVDTLEKENITLKKSIYDLSTHYAATISQGGLKYPSFPYVLDPEVSAQDVITKGQDLINKAVHEAGGSVEGFQSGRFAVCRLCIALTLSNVIPFEKHLALQRRAKNLKSNMNCR
jgi:hypothetical protein